MDDKYAVRVLTGPEREEFRITLGSVTADFNPRTDYLNTLKDMLGTSASSLTWMTMRIWKVDGESNPEYPIETYIDFIMMGTNLQDRERIHLLSTPHDDGKIYFFEKELRQVSFSGFVYDCFFDAKQKAAGFDGDGYSRFKILYEDYFRISKACEKRLVVELMWGQYRLWGAMTSMIGSLASDSPSVYMISFNFWVEAMEMIDPNGIFSYIPGTSKAVGLISRESAIKIGLGTSTPEPNAYQLTINPVERAIETVKCPIQGDIGELDIPSVIVPGRVQDAQRRQTP